MNEKHLSKIAALLRKAESTDNEHEADAFLRAAQRLATLSAVDLAMARAHTADKERRAVPVQRTIEIGERGKRGLRTFVQLFLAIGRANNVTCDIAGDSTRVYAYGFDTDIDSAEALYASLVVQMVRACDVFLKSGGHAQEKVLREVRTVGRHGYQSHVEKRPVHATTARINFQQAFAARVGKRLTEAKEEAQQQAVQQDSTAGVAIVLRAKEVELADHYRANTRARGTWGGYRATAGHSELSRRAGDRAGRNARLGGEKAIGSSRPGIGTGS